MYPAAHPLCQMAARLNNTPASGVFEAVLASVLILFFSLRHVYVLLVYGERLSKYRYRTGVLT